MPIANQLICHAESVSTRRFLLFAATVVGLCFALWIVHSTVGLMTVGVPQKTFAGAFLIVLEMNATVATALAAATMVWLLWLTIGTTGPFPLVSIFWRTALSSIGALGMLAVASGIMAAVVRPVGTVGLSPGWSAVATFTTFMIWGAPLWMGLCGVLAGRIWLPERDVVNEQAAQG